MNFNWRGIFNFFGVRKPVVHLYSICWNEAYLLPYFFRHYDGLVDRYVFFDDDSSDGTAAMIKCHPKAELRQLPRVDGDSFVLTEKEICDHCWKESRGKADWVIITTIDEFLYHRDLRGYLSKCRDHGVTLIPGIGYQMLSDEVPRSSKKLTELVTRGARWSQMDKPSLFNPDKIAEINFEVGRHMAKPYGEIVYPAQDGLLILHYKYLSKEMTFQRHLALHEKLGKVDKEKRWGHKYSWTREELKKDWEMFESDSVENVMLPGNLQRSEPSQTQKMWWRR